MNYHVLVYEEDVAAGAVGTFEELDAVEDTVFSRVNLHYRFQEPYDLLAAYAHGVSIARARFRSPSLAAPTNQHIWPLDRSATIPDRPVVHDFRANRLRLPQRGEELVVETSNNLAMGTEQHHAVLIIAPPAWTPTQIRGVPMASEGTDIVTAFFTATIVAPTDAWSGDVGLTFAENLKGGWYAMLRSSEFGAAHIAHRYVFRQTLRRNKKPLRSGGLSSEAIADTPEEIMWGGGFGVMGYFEADEPPTIQVYSPTGAATAVAGRMMLAFLGDRPPVDLI